MKRELIVDNGIVEETEKIAIGLRKRPSTVSGDDDIVELVVILPDGSNRFVAKIFFDDVGRLMANRYELSPPPDDYIKLDVTNKMWIM